jgi:membrane-associated phospholipid phosphatase
VIRFFAVALIAAVAYAVLGVNVSHAAPWGIDLAGRALAGEAPQLALIFTASCWWYVLVGFGAVALVVAFRSPSWRARAIVSVVTTLVAWQVSDGLKNVFRRPRPEYWRLIHESTFSYSSGHALFATIVYGLWAWFVWRSDLPRPVRLWVATLLVLWACGILWSRLALGAHYITDLIGGVLLGVTALALASGVRAAPARRRSAAGPI